VFALNTISGTSIGPDKGGNLKVIQTTRLASVSLVLISNNFGC